MSSTNKNTQIFDTPSFLKSPQKYVPDAKIRLRLFGGISAIMIIGLIAVGAFVSVKMLQEKENPGSVELYYMLMNIWLGNFGLLGAVMMLLLILAIFILDPIKTIQTMFYQAEHIFLERVGTLERQIAIFLTWTETFANKVIKRVDLQASSGLLESGLSMLLKSKSAGS